MVLTAQWQAKSALLHYLSRAGNAFSSNSNDFSKVATAVSTQPPLLRKCRSTNVDRHFLFVDGCRLIPLRY